MKFYTGEMTLRSGEYKPFESEANRLAGRVGYHDNQPYIPHTRPRIEYPTNKNLQTEIPLESCWDLDALGIKLRHPECDPVCRHGRQACPTKPQPLDVPPSKPRIRKPENNWDDGARETTRWSFDDRPEWVRHQPLEDEAKAGYTNSDNDLARISGDIQTAGETRWLGLFDAVKPGRFRLIGRQPVVVAHLDKDGHRPGEYWAEADAEAVRRRLDANRNKDPVTEMPDLDDPNRYQTPTQRYPGRICANCLDTYELEPHQGTKTRYCSQRCRKYADNARNRGKSGTVKPKDLRVDDWEIVGTTYGYDGMWAVA